MGAIPPAREQWYVVHVLSGQEQKVRDNIRKRIISEEMGDCVFEVLLPQESISDMKNGKQRIMRQKVFPGYLFINMHLITEANTLVEKTWYFIKETAGVINFAASRDSKPTPMRPKEVEQLLKQISEREDSVKPKVAYDIGDTVRVSDGPFESQTGAVEEVDLEHGKLRVAISIFGRSTLVDLEFWQVEKA